MKKITYAILAALLVTVGMVLPVKTIAQQLGTASQVTIGSMLFTEAAAPSGAASGLDLLFGNSADHALTFNLNNGTSQNVGTTVYDTATYSNATTGFTSVTGLSFAVSASRNYHAVCRVVWQASANTAGPKYQFTGPSAPTSVVIGMNSVVTATTVIAATATAFASPLANTGTVTTTTNFTDTVDIGLINGVNAGTVQLQMAANGAGTVTVANGSHCLVQ